MPALYAIGSGKLFGKRLGHSLQKLGNVPEAQNDMIFSIICEELGLFGAVCVILLFVLMLWRMMVIANNAKDLYGALLVTGIMSHIAIQVVLNIAVVPIRFRIPVSFCRLSVTEVPRMYSLWQRWGLR